MFELSTFVAHNPSCKHAIQMDFPTFRSGLASKPDAELRAMIDESHALVVQGLPRARRPG